MTSIPLSPEPSPEQREGQFGRAGHRIAFSVLSGGGNTLLLAGLGALAIRLITVRVGPSNYGLFVIALTFVGSVLLLTDLGITSITGRDIARSPQDAADVLGQNLGLRLILSTVLIPVLIFAAIALYKSSSLRWSIALIAFSLPFNALLTISLSYYVSSIRNYVTSGVTLLQQVIFVVGVVIALTNGYGIIGCSMSCLVSTAVASLVAFFAVRRELSFKPLFDVHRWRQILILSASLGGIQIINLLYLKADTLLLSKMASARSVGLYGVAYNFTSFIQVVPTLIATSVMPLLATSSGDRFAMLLRRMEQSLAVLGVIAVMTTVLFAPQAITILSGHHFLGAAPSLRLLALSCFFSYLCTALGYAAVACNRHHRMIIVSAIGLVLNVGLNLLFIPRFGINGAATATLISEFVALIGVRFIFGRDVGAKLSLTKISVRPVVVGVAVTLFARYVILGSWHASIATVAWAPGIVLLYLGLLALTGGLPEEVDYARRKLKGLKTPSHK
ncbi:MAG TPA: flippase [Acidimicrobiales bacterium]|jgi:O-antigen/teichoic acid export membrane protein|nr:flippase [Acidimicrobiales bacterium]